MSTKKPSFQELRSAEGEESIRFLQEIIYPYLKDYKMMNRHECEAYKDLLTSGDPAEADRIWRHLVDVYQYTSNIVKEKKRKKGEFPEGE